MFWFDYICFVILSVTVNPPQQEKLFKKLTAEYTVVFAFDSFR